uniref:Uncharacterized protein n=1 Tax=Onchocerca volvulus TaxID=6282 RepID=A0A8R1XU52_ONCVO
MRLTRNAPNEPVGSRPVLRKSALIGDLFAKLSFDEQQLYQHIFILNEITESDDNSPYLGQLAMCPE